MPPTAAVNSSCQPVAVLPMRLDNSNEQNSIGGNLSSCCDCDGVRLKAAGYFGVWTAGAAWYIAFAELLNETWFRGRVCLPLLLPIPYQECSFGTHLHCLPDSFRQACLINRGTHLMLALSSA